MVTDGHDGGGDRDGCRSALTECRAKGFKSALSAPVSLTLCGRRDAHTRVSGKGTATRRPSPPQRPRCCVGAGFKAGTWTWRLSRGRTRAGGGARGDPARPPPHVPPPAGPPAPCASAAACAACRGSPRCRTSCTAARSPCGRQSSAAATPAAGPPSSRGPEAGPWGAEAAGGSEAREPQEPAPSEGLGSRPLCTPGEGHGHGLTTVGTEGPGDGQQRPLTPAPAPGGNPAPDGLRGGLRARRLLGRIALWL